MSNRKQAKSTIIIGILFILLIFAGGCVTPNQDSQYRYTAEFTHKSVDGILEVLDDAEEVVGTDETFTLIITSPGGLVEAYETVMNRFNTTPLRTITKIHTYAASAGAFLFILGDERVMEEESRIMFHYARYIMSGKAITQPILEAFLEGRLGELDEEIVDILEKYSLAEIFEALISLSATNKRIHKVVSEVFDAEIVGKLLIHGQDVWLTGKEALELGVATRTYKNAAKRVTGRVS